MTTITAGRVDQIVYEVNNYEITCGHRAEIYTGTGHETTDKLMHDAGCGCDIWQGLILGLDEYDETRTGEIDTGRNDRFALADGTVIIYIAERDTWDVQ